MTPNTINLLGFTSRKVLRKQEQFNDMMISIEESLDVLNDSLITCLKFLAL